MQNLPPPVLLGFLWQIGMALALGFSPQRGTPYALWGEQGSYTFIVLFLASSVVLLKNVDEVLKPAHFVLGTFPLGLYGVANLVYSVFIKGLLGPTTSLTTPLMFLGGYLTLLLASHQMGQIARLHFDLELERRCE